MYVCILTMYFPSLTIYQPCIHKSSMAFPLGSKAQHHQRGHESCQLRLGARGVVHGLGESWRSSGPFADFPGEKTWESWGNLGRIWWRIWWRWITTPGGLQIGQIEANQDSGRKDTGERERKKADKRKTRIHRIIRVFLFLPSLFLYLKMFLHLPSAG